MHLHLHLHLAQILHEIVGERIVIIDDQNHKCGGNVTHRFPFENAEINEPR